MEYSIGEIFEQYHEFSKKMDMLFRKLHIPCLEYEIDFENPFCTLRIKGRMKQYYYFIYADGDYHSIAYGVFGNLFAYRLKKNICERIYQLCLENMDLFHRNNAIKGNGFLVYLSFINEMVICDEKTQIMYRIRYYDKAVKALSEEYFANDYYDKTEPSLYDQKRLKEIFQERVHVE